jgi:hypothetical protein
MPSDSEIRDRFREGTQPRGEIDVDAVMRRVRARRRPRVILAASGSVLAIAAIVVPAVLTTYSTGGAASDTALVAGEDSGGAAAPEAATESGAAQFDRAPAEKLNLCTAPVADVAPAANGLVLTMEPVTAAAGGRDIPVTVTLKNTGGSAVSGYTGGRPALTLSQDGITIWHTNGPQTMIALTIDLQPGESTTYEATFEPVVCGVEDDMAEAFRENLPAAGPGEYLLSAAIDFTRSDGSFVDLVTGPAAALTLE